jgi:hypothetical protein
MKEKIMRRGFQKGSLQKVCGLWRDCFASHAGGQFAAHLAPEDLAFHSQTPPLIIVENAFPSVKLLRFSVLRYSMASCRLLLIQPEARIARVAGGISCFSECLAETPHPASAGSCPSSEKRRARPSARVVISATCSSVEFFHHTACAGNRNGACASHRVFRSSDAINVLTTPDGAGILFPLLLPIVKK